jgi:hypothetical protein
MYGFHQAQLLSNMAIGIFTLRQQLRGLLSKNWTGTIKTPYVEYLVVGGGGAGGYTPPSAGSAGGGGAGGVLTGILPVVAGATNNITVGGGGAGTSSSSANGANSILNSVIAVGGGAGGAGNTSAGTSGGSGGGGPCISGISTAGIGIVGQGNSGAIGAPLGSSPFNGGGGGGAGTIGLAFNASTGGAGIASAISGTVTPYGGGGGGGSTSTPGTGGVGGGEAGGTLNGAGTAGQANTGGGGGGAGNNGTGSNLVGGNGGSGIVIISYPDIYAALTTGGATSPTVSTSGSGSISFNGSTDYLSNTSFSGIAVGTSNFTVEAWVYLNTNSSYSGVFSSYGLTGAGIGLQFNSNGTVSGQVGNGGSAVQVNSPSAVSASTWNHVAFVRNGTLHTLYVNGVSVATTTVTATNVTSTTFIIGRYYTDSSGNLLNGYISNLRFVSSAVYTANFTPSTAPLTAITNTQLLFNTVSGSAFANSSTASAVMTANGTPAWNQLSPFATGLGYKNRVYTWAPTVSAGGTATGTFTV